MNKIIISAIETEIIKKNQAEIMKQKTTITELKILLERCNSILKKAEERISKLENRLLKNIKYEEERKGIRIETVNKT